MSNLGKDSALVHPLPEWKPLTDKQKLRWRRWAIDKIKIEQPEKVTGTGENASIDDALVDKVAEELFKNSLPKGGRRRKTRRRRHRRRTSRR